MLKSKEPPLCSCKNPLWVAAFFFKQLKKVQIMDADISSSVDKIMHYEMDAVSYRILAYLVLGVVKTYSKKVEYLLDDCNDVLSEINKFVINTKNNAPVKAVRMAFIMPDTFELDAIDLGELEDTSGYHTAPPEQITLKEVLSNTGGFAQFSQERFEDFDMQFEGFGFGETSCSLDQLMAENFLQFQPMDFDFEVFPSNSRNNLIEGSSGKQLEFQRKVPFEDGQSSANPLESTTINETPQSKFHDDSTARPKPKPGATESNSRNNLIEGSSEKQLEFQKKVSFEDGQSSTNPSEATIINETPQSKFHGALSQKRKKFHGGSIARPKPGATKSDFMLIPTPDATEGAHFSKKRKFVIDETQTLSNEILRKRIHDASDVVSVRKSLRISLIDKLRKTQMFSLLNGFNESLFPYHSPKLQRLLSNSKLEISTSLKIGSDVQESEAVGIPEHIEIAPEIRPTRSDSVANEEILGEVDAAESQATAPETPPLGPSSPRRSIERGQPSESSDNMEEEEINSLQETNSCETENSNMCKSGWSEQTSKVATYLSNQKEAGSVNLSKVSEGRTRKESARLFYEILVLKTTNYVDVQQKDAYGDIEVRKLPKFDQTFGV
ncbi:sister chromatid cohesion 1 protein 2-like isoform X2 [Trifolium pratense]|uniref:sister chromatid cohesion 1 protein 2-like isoform X2 n=1 Tax=Trifolium pratense TaxID=57577 RepID=UPI001E69415A|nr:sister chromatid cohesion 1 protein 2-like isoform X2 [Trifolium pratense]